MTESEWRAALARRLGDPPRAPQDELARVLARAGEDGPERDWSWPALACALSLACAVVATVAVKPAVRPASLVDLASETNEPYDESLEPYRELVRYVQVHQKPR